MDHKSAIQRVKFLEHRQQELETKMCVHINELHNLKEELKHHDLLATSAEKKITTSTRHNPEQSCANKANAVTQSIPQKKSSPEVIIPPKPPKNPEIIREKKPTREINYHKLEQDFGKVWFVRLGILTLLTGLIFLSNYAYKNYISDWGAAPRLVAMYSLASIMLIIGTYLEKAKAAVSNYGKVLAAGGIATLYYTSYAAHHVDRLKVIDSPLLGSVVLTLSAAACLVYALWKRSEVTAIFSIVLAYYSTSITPISTFSLASGLLLTLTGVILLHKLRSATIGFVSMIGAYASFIYWQILVNPAQTTSTHTAWFIVGYWVLSAASTLISNKSDGHPFSKKQILIFTSINNAFLVLLMSVQFSSFEWITPLWPVYAVIGSSFILIGLLLKFGDKLSSTIDHISFRQSLTSLYLLKGSSLITLALCIALTGPSLAVALTIQATLLLISAMHSSEREKRYFSIASYLILLLGFGFYLNLSLQSELTHTSITYTHLVMTALYLALALLTHLSTSLDASLRKILSISLTIAKIITLTLAIQYSETELFTKILLFLGLNLALTIYDLCSHKKTILPYFCRGSHTFAVIVVAMIYGQMLHNILNPFQLFTITAIFYSLTALNLYTYLQRGKPYLQYTAYLVVSTLLLLVSLVFTENTIAILSITSTLPIIYNIAYKCLIKHDLKIIPIIGLILYPISWLFTGVHSLMYLINGGTFDSHQLLYLYIAVIPIAHIGMTKYKILTPFCSKFTHPVLTLVSAFMLALWQYTYIAEWEISFAITALIYHLLDRNKQRILTLIACLFYSISIVHAALPITNITDSQTFSILYAIASVPLIAYFARYFILGNRDTLTSTPSLHYYADTQKGLAILSSLTIWFVSSYHLISIHDVAALSIVWAVVGLVLLVLGFLSKDIVFRSMAFIILACTVVHVYGVDVWKINALLRILSFITLGIIMLVIGYFYCRKADIDESNDS